MTNGSVYVHAVRTFYCLSHKAFAHRRSIGYSIRYVGSAFGNCVYAFIIVPVVVIAVDNLIGCGNSAYAVFVYIKSACLISVRIASVREPDERLMCVSAQSSGYDNFVFGRVQFFVRILTPTVSERETYAEVIFFHVHALKHKRFVGNERLGRDKVVGFIAYDLLLAFNDAGNVFRHLVFRGNVKLRVSFCCSGDIKFYIGITVPVVFSGKPKVYKSLGIDVQAVFSLGNHIFKITVTLYTVFDGADALYFACIIRPIVLVTVDNFRGRIGCDEIAVLSIYRPCAGISPVHFGGNVFPAELRIAACIQMTL